MINKIIDARFKHDNVLDDIKVSLAGGVVFLFPTTLPDGIEPKINDEIFVKEGPYDYHFVIKKLDIINDPKCTLYALSVSFWEE